MTNASLPLDSNLLKSNWTAVALCNSTDHGCNLTSVPPDELVDFLIFGIGDDNMYLIEELAYGQRPVLGFADSEDSASRCGTELTKNQRAFHLGKRTPGKINSEWDI